MHILKEPFQPGPTPCFANVLLHQGLVAEGAVSAIRSGFLGLEVQVILDLAFQITFQDSWDASKGSSQLSSWAATRAMAPTSCFHFNSSAINCFLPPGVIR